MPEMFIIGSCVENPKLNSVVHDAEFYNGKIKEHSANMIAEIRLTMFGSEGFLLTLIDSIVDWNKDKTAIGMVDKHFVISNG